MEVEQVLHMNDGQGDDSYDKNSAVQRKIISVANVVIEEAIRELLSDINISKESIGIADLGCSSGTNTFVVISEIIDAIGATCDLTGRLPPELRVSLNDLFSNDFNSLFQSLPVFLNKLNDEKCAFRDKCFVSGVAGSFYGRLFARGSLHFVHSSSSLHWLSQVPKALQSDGARTLTNKGKIYISVTSPPCIVNAYFSQFQNDFSIFLKSRSEEMATGGRMVLSFMGRRSGEPPTEVSSCFQWELFAQALMSMASQGLVDEEKIDSFDAPYYAPSPEEIKHVVRIEGSFIINRIETFETDWNAITQDQINESEAVPMSRGQYVAKFIRAVVEPMFESHFGKEIMDELFLRYGENMDDHLSKKKIRLPWTRFHKGLKARERFMDKLEKKMSKRREDMGAYHEDFLQHLLMEDDKASSGDDEIKDNILTMIIAGQDTTASAMTWMVKYLDENQEVLQTLKDELIPLSRRTSSSSMLTLEDLNNMPYASKVVKESLRMASIVPWFPRLALQDCEIHGYNIKRGWNINIDAKSIHLDPTLYKDPDKFFPSRFEDETKPYSFLAFGQGGRTCLGMNLAKAMMLIFLHRIVTTYKWKVTDSDSSLEKWALFSKLKSGCPVEITPIEESINPTRQNPKFVLGGRHFLA